MAGLETLDEKPELTKSEVMLWLATSLNLDIRH
jgi:hypothetical protein